MGCHVWSQTELDMTEVAQQQQQQQSLRDQSLNLWEVNYQRGRKSETGEDELDICLFP